MGKIGAIVAQVIAQPLLKIGAPETCKGNECHPWIDHLMQIFALFMLCGTLVSFLVPETKGRTLEELSGESTTLDRRISEVDKEGGWKRWYMAFDIFGGGKPAGFFTQRKGPNLGPRSPGIRGKRQRLGIMTSPELIPKKNPKGKGHKKGEKRDSSYESSTNAPNYSVSVVSSNANREMMEQEGMDEIYIHSEGQKSPRLPGWGAGWAVERNERRADGRVESILLNDVGKLLK
jgi:PHS family inorganic phosphate transporter-like MFS transporter